MYETLREIAKKTLVFDVFKSFIFQVHGKRQNTSTQFSLPPTYSHKYPYKHLAINIV